MSGHISTASPDREPALACSGWERAAVRGPFVRKAAWLLLLSFMANPGSIRACAACYGQSDSPMAHGLNWGIFSLLLVVVVMLSGITSFFVYLAKRSATPPTKIDPSPIIHH